MLNTVMKFSRNLLIILGTINKFTIFRWNTCLFVFYTNIVWLYMYDTGKQAGI